MSNRRRLNGRRSADRLVGLLFGNRCDRRRFASAHQATATAGRVHGRFVAADAADAADVADVAGQAAAAADAAAAVDGDALVVVFVRFGFRSWLVRDRRRRRRNHRRSGRRCRQRVGRHCHQNARRSRRFRTAADHRGRRRLFGFLAAGAQGVDFLDHRIDVQLFGRPIVAVLLRVLLVTDGGHIDDDAGHGGGVGHGGGHRNECVEHIVVGRRFAHGHADEVLFGQHGALRLRFVDGRRQRRVNGQ